MDEHDGDSCRRLTLGTRGAPDAWKHARPVRRAGRGNGPGAISIPRLGPTHRHRPEPRSTDECQVLIVSLQGKCPLTWDDGSC